MVLLDLLFSCDCENVAVLDVGGPSYEWHVNLKCSQCSQVNEDEVYFSADKEQEIPNSRGSCNFLMKCKFCKNVMNICVDPKSPFKANLQGKVKQQVLATFECRGGELIGWNAKGLKVKSELSNIVFEEVDLTDTWVDYDEQGGSNCMIENFSYQFERSKK